MSDVHDTALPIGSRIQAVNAHSDVREDYLYVRDDSMSTTIVAMGAPHVHCSISSVVYHL